MATTKKKKVVPKATRIRRLAKKCHEAWSLVVRLRDKTCRRCGAEGNLAAHHWIVSKARSRQDRFNPANGCALDYGCHIRVIHNEASYANAVALYNKMLETVPEQEILDVLARAGQDSPEFTEEGLTETLANLEKMAAELQQH
jgi:hypothetical protein